MASEDEQCQAVVKAMMTISKAEDVQKMIELMMRPYANWEEYLSLAPLSIALLGNLICISAGQGDFSINKNPPLHGFKYIKYPDSFRACLCQVSNEGWHAFNEAHVNMDQIRLLTASIPGRIKVMVQTFFQEIEVVGALLPGQIKRLKSIAEQCLSRAVAVKDKYASVISLVQELLETCINAKLGHEKELEEVKTAIDQTKIKEKAAQDAKALAEKHHKQLEHQIKVEQSQEMLKEAQEASERSFAELKQRNQEMTDLLCKMESFKAKEIDFEAVLKMLTKGLKALGDVKEQWEKMIQFFQMMSNVSDVQQIEGYSSHAFMKDLIYNQVCSANIAYLVHMIAESYTELSEKYLMGPISSLGRLITLEPSDPEFEEQRHALNKTCEVSKSTIYYLVIKKKEEYDRNVQATLMTMDREILDGIPPVLPPTEKKMIKDAEHQGIRELTPEEEDQFV